MTKKLTASEIKFSHLVGSGYSLTRAYKIAFPSKKHLNIGTIRNNASKLMTKDDISSEVATHQTKQVILARQAEDRLEEILTEGDIGSKENKVADVAMWMYEQANGKATQKVQVESRHLEINIDLTGSGEEVPQHIIDELKQATT